ncbi:MAG: helix-hairpin-helix domain-containing protein [bacterium]
MKYRTRLNDGVLMLRFVFVFFLTIASLAAEQPLQSISGCTLVQAPWADGDSFPVHLPDGRTVTVRLYGADCIEWHVNDETDARRLRAQRRYFGIGGDDANASMAKAKSFGDLAAKRTRELLGKPFTLHTAFSDARGGSASERFYGFITTAEGRDHAAVLVEEGLARAVGLVRRLPDGSDGEEYRNKLRDIELTAAVARKGIWASTDWKRLTSDRAVERAENAELASFLKPAIPAGGINLNTATQEEIEALPGIGKSLAERIIAARADRVFVGADDLLRIKGVTPKLINKIESNLRFDKPEPSSKKAK